jgi:hypothetical protein
VGGLPWLNPTDVRGVKPEGRKKNLKFKKKLFLFYFYFFRVGRRRQENKNKNKNIFF